MPKNIVQYDLLISCPGDVKNEIGIIEEVVSQFNTQFSDTLGISIRTKHWQKNSYAQSGGKPQALLNEQFVNDCDAAVAILWAHFGTPTDEYDSGTEEEIKNMLSSGKQVFMYFSDKPLSPSQMNENELNKVKTFRDKYKEWGIYSTYSSDDEFKKLFFAHLSQYFLSEKRVAELKGERHSELKVVGIDKTQHVSDKAVILSFIPNGKTTTSKYLEKIRTLFSNISAIKLRKRAELLTFDKPIEISENGKQTICFIAKSLSIDIAEDFFALGNLSQSSVATIIPGSTSLTGTYEEKEKYYAIQELLDTISKVVKWAPLEKAFTDKKCLKLALQNCGTDIDEDIEISLVIPKKGLLTVNEFPKFDNDAKGYLLNDCDMSEFFGICSTSEYLDYDASIRANHRFSPRAVTSTAYIDYTPDYSDDFKSVLDEIFCYSCFDDNEVEYVLKLKVDYIKHYTTIAFPSVIFVKDFFESIPYTITSKNSPDIISGKIQIINDIHTSKDL